MGPLQKNVTKKTRKKEEEELKDKKEKNEKSGEKGEKLLYVRNAERILLCWSSSY